MLHPIISSPTQFSPSLAMVADDTYELDLGSVEVVQFKTAGLFLRVHTGVANLKLRLIAYGVWPFENDQGLRFQDSSGTPLFATNQAQGGTGDAGLLFSTSGGPASIAVPALRVVLELEASGSVATSAKFVVSAGLVLHEG